MLLWCLACWGEDVAEARVEVCMTGEGTVVIALGMEWWDGRGRAAGTCWLRWCLDCCGEVAAETNLEEGMSREGVVVVETSLAW